MQHSRFNALLRRSNRACTYSAKLSFRSPEEAERRRKQIKRRRGEQLHVYRCRCGKWHLGHPAF